MTSMLCLAHYCDTHGPTSLMVTDGMPVACSACSDDDSTASERRDSISRSVRSAGGFQNFSKSFASTATTSSSGDVPSILPSSSPAIETPPESPRLASLHPARNPSRHRRDSSFRRTYDENDKKRAVACDNCALTLPQKVKEQIPEGAPGSPTKNGQGFTGSPILRTRKPFERVAGSVLEDRSPKSSSIPSDSDEGVPSERRKRIPLSRNITSSSTSSLSSNSSGSHTHYLDYTSTHEPISSEKFSKLRASCLRTLSCETLPPSGAGNGPPTPTSPYGGRSPPTNPAIASGGPIFFGDPHAGYTTAYIFRVPDPYARGRRRIYAFIFLSSARERAAMQAFSYLAAAFRDLASWIQNLAEIEIEKMDSGTAPESEFTNTRRASETDSKKTTPTSSFLSGRPCDPDGYPRRGMMSFPRSRGLAELVGRADFFLELHARFVALLAQLSAMFNC